MNTFFTLEEEPKYFKVAPPLIYFDNHIELFGSKGREIYYVKKINFYSCHLTKNDCVHNLTLQTICGECFSFGDIPYDELIKKGYIKFISKKNQGNMNIIKNDKCKLINVPAVF